MEIIVGIHLLVLRQEDFNLVSSSGQWKNSQLKSLLLTRYLIYTALVAVHSFKENIYDILDLGPYEVRFTGQVNHSDIIPSPVFYPLFYHNLLAGTFCHAATPEG